MSDMTKQKTQDDLLTKTISHRSLCRRTVNQTS